MACSENRSERRREILRVLEQDGRVSSDKLSVMLGIPRDEVEQEIAGLERERVILKYKAVINWERIGEDKVLALIEVRVTPRRGTGFDKVAQRIARFSEVRTLYLLSGTYDLLVMVEGETMQSVANFVAEKLATLEDVQGTVSHFLLKKYKKDGDIIEGQPEGLERLPIAP